jgi:hypothetical protein
MSTLSMDMFGAPACTFCGGAQTVNCADCGMQCKCVQGKIMPLMD